MLREPGSDDRQAARPLRDHRQARRGRHGEVYRATDSRLKRDVAIKVLPPAFTEDKERLARFEREAQLLAQLNHPNIAQIYGLETSGATHALVMELVPGPTLDERLAAGPFSLTESLSVALQLALALEEAHEKGIVHRDLKPQNIKASSDGRVKVLDFGLAKAMDPAGAPASAGDLARSPTLMNSPTLTAVHGTQLGVILGTAAYMAPEQARGGAADKRADIWAFGVVLYEMLTGRSLFAGPTVSDTLAGVLKSEIDWRALPAGTPAAIRSLVRCCLERNPKNRLHDIADARIVLEEQIGGKVDEAIPGGGMPAVSAAGRSRLVGRLALGIAALALAGLAWTLATRGRSDDRPRPAARFQILPPEEAEFNSTDGPLELSPDGQSLLFRLEKPDGEHGLAIRRLDSFDIRELPGTTRAYDAFWSADGRSIGFFRSHLETIDAAGLQPPLQLAAVRDGRGGSWSSNGTILFAPDPTGAIYRIGASGGTPVAVTEVDAKLGELAHMRPSFLPDGEHFVYLIKAERVESSGIFVGALDGKLKKRLLPSDTAPRFAPPSFLLLFQSDRLVARRLDLERLAVTGEAVELADGVEYTTRFESLPASASLDGRLVYHQPSTGQLRQTVRTDRLGKRLATIGEPGDSNLDLSPDGRRLAVVRFDPERRRQFVWIHDLARDVRFPLSPDSPASGPVWSPDNRTVAYAAETSTEPRIATRPADGGPERVVWRDPFIIEPVDWSPDGRWILAEVGSAAGRTDLMLVPADGTGGAVPFANQRFNEDSGRFSPDGRFIAYVSDESGRAEIYIEPVARSGAKWLVSGRGGKAPRWSSGGRELLYVEPGAREADSTLASVRVEPHGDGLVFGQASPVAPIPSLDIELAADGRELLVTVPVAQGVTRPPILIENWTALLPAK
ncbi:MAG: protein kinase [Thermoanaerobaculia bacterium]